MSAYLLVAAGALAAGFVSGLAGFGTGLVALGVWLHVLDPAAAAALVVICSVAAQLQSFAAIRSVIDRSRLWPFLAGGFIGVPAGTATLRYVDPVELKVALGVFLVAWSGLMLSVRRFPVVGAGGRSADAAVGLGSGVLGGIAGLSGVLMTIWCGLRGWPAREQRAVYQPFNLLVLGFALCAYFASGLITIEVGGFAACALPATIVGTQLGLRAWGRLNDRQFTRIVLGILLVSGVVLVATNLGGAGRA